MGWLAFFLLDLIPFLTDMLVPILLIGYGSLRGSVFIFVCGLLYMYSVWGPLISEGKIEDIKKG